MRQTGKNMKPCGASKARRHKKKDGAGHPFSLWVRPPRKEAGRLASL